MKKLSLFVILLSLFLLCSCPPSLKQEEPEPKVYQVTLKDGEENQIIYYKGSVWYSSESCDQSSVITSITHKNDIPYTITYDLQKSTTEVVEGVTPESIPDQTAYKRFTGYYCEGKQIADNDGVLQTVTTPYENMEAEAIWKMDEITLPSGILSFYEEFKGWSTTEDRSGEIINGKYTPEGETTTLYAVWIDSGDRRNVNFEFPEKAVKIKVDENEIQTDTPYPVTKDADFVFTVVENESFELNSVEYKFIGEESYNPLDPIDGKYTIPNITKHLHLKISVTVNTIPISFEYQSTDKNETYYLKYKTVADEDITSPVNVGIGEDYSFKISDTPPWGSGYYNVRVWLYYNNTCKELLNNEDGTFTIKGSVTSLPAPDGIKVKSEYVDNVRLNVGNTSRENVVKIYRVVDDQSARLPLEWQENYGFLIGYINKDALSNFKFKILLSEDRYKITTLNLSYRSNGRWYDGPEYLFNPSEDGVYTIDTQNINSWEAIQLGVELQTLWYPLEISGNVTVKDVESQMPLTTTIMADKSTSFTLQSNDTSKIVSAVSVEYKTFDYDQQQYVRVTKSLSGIKNAEGQKVYTIPSDMVIDTVKITVALVDKNVSLRTSGDGVSWTLANGGAFPSDIQRFSYFSFKVNANDSSKVIDTVRLQCNDILTTLLPDENGIYTLTEDMTIDTVYLSATTRLPINDVTINFEGNNKAVFKKYPSGEQTERVSVKEKTEYRFTVEISDEQYDIDRVSVVYNGTKIEIGAELINDKMVYTLTPYITSFNCEVYAEVKYKEVTLNTDASDTVIYTSSDGSEVKTSLSYKTEYKFKVSLTDMSKKITRIKVYFNGTSSDIPVFYLYSDENGVYTLPADDVVDNITLNADIVDSTGDSVVMLDSAHPTASVSCPENQIPYVLITNFTPSETYASEGLKDDTSTSNPWDKVRSNNIYSYSLYPSNVSRSVMYSQLNALSVNNISSPEIKDGKVVWNNFSFDDGQYIKNYRELYTDKDNKIIYLLDSTYSVSDNSPARKLIDYMYNNPQSDAKMPNDLLVKLQDQVAEPNESFPNKSYLFNKSATDKGYFFVIMDKFQNRGWLYSVGGYFSSDIYSGKAENTPYAAFYLNTCSSFTDGWDYAAEKDGNYYGVASNFISTLSHEYTHYLESDYKHTNAYSNTGSVHFLSEGYANYVAGKGTKDTTFDGKLGIYLSELLGGHKIYEPKDSDDTSYGLGYLFFMYIEEKYGVTMPGMIMRDDNALLKTVEYMTGEKFADIYNDFILNLVFSGYTGTINTEGKTYGDMSFAQYTQWNDQLGEYGDYEDVHGFESVYSAVARNVKNNSTQITDQDTEENIYNDVKMILEGNEGVSSQIGEMSFRLVCYPNGAPNGITLTSDSPYIKAYLFYSDKKPNE